MIGISEALLISFYISGLKPTVRHDLQLNRPTTLEETFALALVFEGKHLESQADARSFARGFHRATSQSSPNGANRSTGYNSNNIVSSSPAGAPE